MGRRFVLLFVLAGCGPGAMAEPDGGDTGPPSADAGALPDAGPLTDAGFDAGVECPGPVDTTCPATLPHPGGTCAMGLTCSFPDPQGTWEYTCPAGRWEAEAICDPSGPPGSCPVPPLAETCSDPSTDVLSGATIEIGPVSDGPFRAFTDREMVEPVIGGQGSAMVQYRIRIGGVVAPDCIRAITTIAGPIIETVPERRSVTLRCGHSLGMLTIVPEATPCPRASQSVTLTVDIEGIGMESVTLVLPDIAFCGGLG